MNVPQVDFLIIIAILWLVRTHRFMRMYVHAYTYKSRVYVSERFLSKKITIL